MILFQQFDHSAFGCIESSESLGTQTSFKCLG